MGIPNWQRRTCYCGQPMRYVGVIHSVETEARWVPEYYGDEGEFEYVCKDVTFPIDLDKWVCPAGHDYTEYPFFRSSE